jgi:hypothetical protein
MTLCIGALSQDRGYSRAIICVDKRVETDASSAENELKFTLLSPTWCALLAGPLPEAKELVDIYSAYLKQTEICGQDIIEYLREPPRTLRLRLANALTHQRVAMSYDEYLEVGKEQLHEDVYRQLSYDISMQRLLRN